MRLRTWIAAALFAGGCVAPHGAVVTDVDSRGWSDTARIDFTNEDSLGLRDMRLFVRHDNRFAGGRLGLQVIVLTPDSAMTSEHAVVNFRTSDADAALRREATALYRRRIRLGRRGRYSILLVPDTTIRGVEAVGIRLDASK